jgi:hypothetical protein
MGTVVVYLHSSNIVIVIAGTVWNWPCHLIFYVTSLSSIHNYL